MAGRRSWNGRLSRSASFLIERGAANAKPLDVGLFLPSETSTHVLRERNRHQTDGKLLKEQLVGDRLDIAGRIAARRPGQDRRLTADRVTDLVVSADDAGQRRLEL